MRDSNAWGQTRLQHSQHITPTTNLPAAAASTSTRSMTPAAAHAPRAAAPALHSTGEPAQQAGVRCWPVMVDSSLNMDGRQCLSPSGCQVLPAECQANYRRPRLPLVQPVRLQLRPRLGRAQASGAGGSAQQQHQQHAGSSSGGRAGRHADGAARQRQQCQWMSWALLLLTSEINDRQHRRKCKPHTQQGSALPLPCAIWCCLATVSCPIACENDKKGE